MIPTAALPERIIIEPFTGATTGNGAPAHDVPLTAVPARRVGKRRQIRTSDGVDVICDDQFDTRPLPVDVPPQSLITCGSDVFTVLAVIPIAELRRPHHVQFLVEGPRPVAA